MQKAKISIDSLVGDIKKQSGQREVVILYRQYLPEDFLDQLNGTKYNLIEKRSFQGPHNIQSKHFYIIKY